MSCFIKVEQELDYYGIKKLTPGEIDAINQNCKMSGDYLSIAWMIRHQRAMNSIKSKLMALGVNIDSLTDAELRWISEQISADTKSHDEIAQGISVQRSLGYPTPKPI